MALFIRFGIVLDVRFSGPFVSGLRGAQVILGVARGGDRSAVAHRMLVLSYLLCRASDVVALRLTALWRRCGWQGLLVIAIEAHPCAYQLYKTVVPTTTR